MATALTPTPVSRAGVTIAPAAGDVAGNTFPNDGNTVLVVQNSGASPYNLTLNFAVQVDGQTVTAKTVAVSTGAYMAIGPFPVDKYGSTVSVTPANIALKLQVLTGLVG